MSKNAVLALLSLSGRGIKKLLRERVGCACDLRAEFAEGIEGVAEEEVADEEDDSGYHGSYQHPYQEGAGEVCLAALAAAAARPDEEADQIDYREHQQQEDADVATGGDGFLLIDRRHGLRLRGGL